MGNRNEWYMKVTSGITISTFTSTGSGNTWDLTSYEASSTEDTIVIGAATLLVVVRSFFKC